MKRVLILLGVTVFCLASAQAGMVDRLSYTAEGAGISIDAVGLADNTLGQISANIPTGANIFRAYLYSANVASGTLSNVLFEGNTLVSDALSRLDVGARETSIVPYNFKENIWDVTSIVNGVVGGGSGTFNFDVTELGYLDGEILAVLYNIPSEPVTTAFLFDGELAVGGDSFTINLGTPVNKADPNFLAKLSLGIAYGYQGSSQYTLVDVNGLRLSSSAGGQDDGFGANGGLITAGGIGDSITNPVDPNAFPSSFGYDDELYDITSYLTNGDTSVTFTTFNPSNDDNVFFAAFTTLGEASVVDGGGEVVGPGPDPEIPEPTTMLLLGSGLLGLAGLRKKKA